MKRLLNIEFQKLFRNKASMVIILAYFIIQSFIAIIASTKLNLEDSDIEIFNFPFIWHFNTYIAAFFKLFLAIVIVSMMANEYSYGTLRQNLIDGMSKKEFILSKFLALVVFAAVSTIFIFIISLILGYSYSPNTNISLVASGLEYLLAYFVKLVGFFSSAYFLVILVKKSAFTLGILLIWNIVEAILKGVLSFIFFREGNTSLTISQFFPLESMSNLIVEPLTRLTLVKNFGTQIGVENVKDYGVHWYSISIVVVWIIIFTFASYKLLEKRDI